MSLWVFLVAAAALSIERICYIRVWRYPESFRALCSRSLAANFGAPVAILQKLFYCFKAIQLTVFFGWCYRYGNGSIWPINRNVWPLAAGSADRCRADSQPQRLLPFGQHRGVLRQ